MQLGFFLGQFTWHLEFFLGSVYIVSWGFLGFVLQCTMTFSRLSALNKVMQLPVHLPQSTISVCDHVSSLSCAVHLLLNLPADSMIIFFCHKIMSDLNISLNRPLGQLSLYVDMYSTTFQQKANST